MIILKQAPAGFIGQVFRNGIDPGDSLQRTVNFLDVTGSWSSTPQLAAESCRKELGRKKEKLKARIAKLQAELEDLEEDHEVWVK
jgi:hypothetical protein